MADRVFFLSGSPEDFLPPEMVSDLCAVSGLDPAAVGAFADALAAATGFVGDRRLKELVGEHLGDASKLLLPVGRTLANMRPKAVKDTVARLRRWNDVQAEDGKAPLDEEALNRLEANLSLLAGKFPALRRQQKALGLMRETGNSFEDVAFLCDLRPVFDEEREHVEGLLPLVTVRVDYQTPQREERSFEVTLSESDMKALEKKLEAAKKKLSELKDKIRTWVPDGTPDTEE